ncbi:hypothetical protein [Mangrovimonas aestuarii]|uniref:hypothetical protein n=1 Tax=Mangrovimonas aestuarii TaxID=3018443 RepID=UPI0023780F9D|nr:hypothetical protein [Mangrovimonas aestuarii]
MDRKTFIYRSFAALLLAIPAYSVLSCSSSSDDGGNNNEGGSGYGNGGNNPPSQQGNCLENGANASSISGNHGHSLVVSMDDVVQGTQKTYSIQGNADHNHNVTLGPNDFSDLQANQSIVVSSTSGSGHNHSVTVSCA